LLCQKIVLDINELGGFFAYSQYSTTGIERLKGNKSSQVVVTPIPAASEIFIRVDDAALCGQPATITDIQGRLVLRFLLEPQSSVNIHEWPVGVYCLRLPDGDVVRIVKR